LFQPIADALKMITKEDIVPTAADAVLHFLAPVALVCFALMSFAVIPLGRHLVPVELDAAVLYFFAATGAAELAVFMAGWASHNKFALLGGMRAIAQLISYELPLFLTIVPVIMLTGTMSTTEIVDAQGGWAFGFLPGWFVFTPWGFAAFIIFTISALAESSRAPFDLPEAESELIAGHLTEYSGFKYALFFMAEYLGMTARCGFGVTLFLGGWRAPFPFLEIIPSYVWFGIKLLSMIFLFMWIRGTVPRLRMDQLMRLAWKFLVPLTLINLGNAVFWYASADWAGPMQIARWVASILIIVVPFVVIGRRLSAGVGPRTYRFAT
jgi:NADH-quinone oxidoreductase subunit H